MCKKITVVFFLLLTLATLPSAFASDSVPPGTIQIRNREYQSESLSFDAVLSDAGMEGQLVVSVYSERGQFRDCEFFPADTVIRVSLDYVDSTDYVEVAWLDRESRILAVHDRLRMSENGAQAYAEFSDQLTHLLESYSGGSGAESADPHDPYSLARLIVRCVTLPDLSSWQVVDKIAGPDGLYVLQFNTAAQARECAEYLQAQPGVRYAEPDTVVGVDVPEAGAFASLSSAEDGAAGQHYSWGVDATGIGQYAAYLAERGVARRVTVAVVDSGVDIQHPFLIDRVTGGYDLIDGGDPMDESGHGTHVAGIIADCTAGLDVRIMPVRVLNGFNVGYSSVIALGIYYAADQNVDVINLSLSDSSERKNIDDAVQYAISKNITVVAAAGNQMTDTSRRTPAHMEECITVSAIREDKTHYTLSNWGDAVDLAAPGEYVLSSVPHGTGTGYTDTDFDYKSGTSMAAPYVSAAAALLMSELGTGLTPEQISDTLREASMDLGTPGWDRYFGAGMLDMRGFVQSGAYAVLYADGEMVFQKSRTPDSGRTVVQTYPIRLSSGGGSEYAGWYEHRDKIRKVTFADTIQPASTALWFYDCANLPTLDGLENLDTSKVTDMSQMFAECTALTELDLTAFDTANVTDMTRMFFACSALETIKASDTFTTTNATASRDMFRDCTVLKGGRGTGYNSAYTDKAYARVDAVSVPGYFTEPEPEQIYAVLYDDGELVFQNGNRTESGRNVTDVYEVKDHYKSGDYPSWRKKAESITTATIADRIQPVSTAYWFSDLKKLTNIENIENLNTRNVTDMACMFIDCYSLSSLDVSGFDTSNVTDMAWMFYECSGLTSLDVSAFDTSNVTTMIAMFEGCSRLTSLDVSGFNTSNVMSMESMFNTCSHLTSLDVSGFDTSKVTNMGYMFERCSHLVSLDVSGFDTKNVINMGNMFYECSGLTSLDFSGFDTSKVTNMNAMFYDCKSITVLDLSSFDTAHITEIGSKRESSNIRSGLGMFEGCRNLKTIYVSPAFVTTQVGEYFESVFSGCTSLVGGRGTTYGNSHVNVDYARIDGGPSAPGYFTRKYTESGPILGDVNEDKVIDQADVEFLREAIVGKRTLSDSQKYAADVNGDGDANIGDVIAIRQYLVGVGDEF